MAKDSIRSKLDRVEKIASASMLGRMMHNPLKYISAIGYREILYKHNHQAKDVIANTFFDIDMHIKLPASMDIYLTAGKSHNSEIRLAKYLINQLDHGDTFIDIGAHYGYFSLLASRLVGDLGHIHAFEASPTNFEVLEKNAQKTSNIHTELCAVSDEHGRLSFYEFPNQFSEYNTFNIEQFKEEKWYKFNTPEVFQVECVPLDAYISSHDIDPKVIKIDVEGAEYSVINGMKHLLSTIKPTIVMEYLSEIRGNEPHQKAEELLRLNGYQSYRITNDGELKSIQSAKDYLSKSYFETDNIVFCST